MRFKINFYLNETAFKSGVVQHSEILTCDRNFAVNWAQQKIRTTNFKFYDIQQL